MMGFFALISYEMHEAVSFMSFIYAAVATLVPSLSVFFLTFDKQNPSSSTKDIFMLTAGIWISSIFFSSLVFYFEFKDYSLIDGFFDAASALTTTGCQVPHKTTMMLIWRSLLQSIGGIGIIVVILAILPMGGMQLFRSEFSDPSEKIVPRISGLSIALVSIYGAFTLLSMFFLKLSDQTMPWWIAWVNASSAISTSGTFVFEGPVNSATRIILACSMFFGECSFLFVFKFYKKGLSAIYEDVQFCIYAMICLSMVVFFTIVLHKNSCDFSQILFFVTSFFSTTGFADQLITSMPTFSIGILMILSIVGGCAGSTSGGIKIYRVYYLVVLSKMVLKKMIFPHEYTPIFYRYKTLLESLLSFMTIYIMTFLLTSVIFMMNGFSIAKSFASSMMTIGNIGDGFLTLCGIPFDYQNFSAPIKLIMTLAMVVGRLEVVGVIVLLSPFFWNSYGNKPVFRFDSRTKITI